MKKILFLIYLLCCSHPVLSQAQFDITGTGILFLASGEQKPLEYRLQYIRQEGQYRFTAGQQTLTVPAVPKKYSVPLFLQDGRYTLVPDFSDQLLTGFELTFGEYVIRLYQDETARTARGRFVLTLNGESHYYSQRPGQISFYFNESGIENIVIEGMLRPYR